MVGPDWKEPARMRTLAVCLLLALPASVAASDRPHRTPHTPKDSTNQAPRSKAVCQIGCRIHRQRVAVRHLRRKIVRRSLVAFLPHPRPAHLSWKRSQVRRELRYWTRTDRRTRALASVPLARRIPRWREWHCIARYESNTTWSMSPSSEPSSGGAYWGGLQMDISFQETYGADMIARHHGGLADTWTEPEQITVANRAWETRGFQPWPNTARACGLL
jgi:hypothetical protein